MPPISIKKILVATLVIAVLSQRRWILALIRGLGQAIYDSFEPLRQCPAEARFVAMLAFSEMRINRRLVGTVADRPIDTVVSQEADHIPADAQGQEAPPQQMSAIDRIAAMLNGSTPIQSDAWIGRVPTYRKGWAGAWLQGTSSIEDAKDSRWQTK
jgi:hypothetical protein